MSFTRIPGIFFSRSGAHRNLHLRTHSFPTRRSSDPPANPTNVLVDVYAVVAARNTLFSDEEEKPPIVIDNTFLGPLWQKPLRHGVDMVVYSLTKYAGGQDRKSTRLNSSH